MLELLEHRDNGVVLAFSGDITSSEIMDANTAIIEHPDFADLRYQLWIFDPVTDFVLSMTGIMHLAQQDMRASLRNPHVRVAIVSKSPLVYGFARMYEAFVEGGSWETMVFYDRDKAEAWLAARSDLA